MKACLLNSAIPWGNTWLHRLLLCVLLLRSSISSFFLKGFILKGCLPFLLDREEVPEGGRGSPSIARGEVDLLRTLEKCPLDTDFCMFLSASLPFPTAIAVKRRAKRLWRGFVLVDRREDTLRSPGSMASAQSHQSPPSSFPPSPSVFPSPSSPPSPSLSWPSAAAAAAAAA